MRALIAGLGNVFARDDGFGSAVAAVLAGRDVPSGTEVHDVGIRGVHLAYQLLDPYDVVVLVDAVTRDGEPGTLYVIEHRADADRPGPTGAAPLLDAHDLAPDEVLALVPMLGGSLPRVVVVGCEPESVGPGMGLSEPVASRVERAADLAVDIVRGELHPAGTSAGRLRSGG